LLLPSYDSLLLGLPSPGRPVIGESLIDEDGRDFYCVGHFLLDVVSGTLVSRSESGSVLFPGSSFSLPLDCRPVFRSSFFTWFEEGVFIPFVFLAGAVFSATPTRYFGGPNRPFFDALLSWSSTRRIADHPSAVREFPPGLPVPPFSENRFFSLTESLSGSFFPSQKSFPRATPPFFSD